MIGRTNVGGGGNTFAFIVVTYPAGSVCTCSDGTRTIRAKGTTGSFVFNIPYAETWTITCTNGSDTDSADVTISNEGQREELELSYRVPSEYQAVEYIQPTGTQYINDALPNETAFKVEIDANFLSNYTGSIFGRSDGNTPSASLQLDVNYTDGNTSCVAHFGSLNTMYVNAGSAGNKVIESSFEISGVTNMLKVNDARATSSSGYVSEYIHGATIFATRYINSNYTNIATGIQLKAFKWYDKDGVLARDFAPCYRKSDNVAGLWDVVNKVFYTNNGTGSFTVGPDVV